MPSSKRPSCKKNFNTSSHADKSTVKKIRKRKSSNEAANLSHGENTHSENGVSPESLAKRLDKYCSTFISHKNEYCDLADFEFDVGIENLEKLHEMREQICQKLTNFDFSGRTNVNLDGAALAGARVLIEERPTTRSITKKLTNEVGVDTDNLLYAGLPYEGAEIQVAKDIHDERTESIIESFVDFQKQLRFKMSVLGHAIKKIKLNGESKSVQFLDRRPGRTRAAVKQGTLKNMRRNANKTPKMRQNIDPLSFNKIIDEYALEVASEVTNKMNNRRRNLAPIPLSFSILDEI